MCLKNMIVRENITQKTKQNKNDGTEELSAIPLFGGLNPVFLKRQRWKEQNGSIPGSPFS